MAIPLHPWLKDNGGADIRGSSEVFGREGSIEVLSLTHGIHTPTDSHTGMLMGARSHHPLTIEKEIDRASALLYKAVARGETLQSGELKFYRTNDAGMEEVYFTISMKNVKVVGVSPKVPNIKEVESRHRNHFEIVEFRYGEISWAYADGNMIFKDAWSWFMLWNPHGGDTTMINGIQRGNFRLHPEGSLHLSEGCITVVSHFEFDRLQRYVRTRQPDLPVPGTTLRAYGTVEVR